MATNGMERVERLLALLLIHQMKGAGQGDKAMLLSPRDPVSRWPTLFLAKVNAFGILQNYEEALVWIERGEAATPEMPLWDFMRSALLSLTGKEADARVAMQRSPDQPKPRSIGSFRN